MCRCELYSYLAINYALSPIHPCFSSDITFLVWEYIGFHFNECIFYFADDEQGNDDDSL